MPVSGSPPERSTLRWPPRPARIATAAMQGGWLNSTRCCAGLPGPARIATCTRAWVTGGACWLRWPPRASEDRNENEVVSSDAINGGCAGLPRPARIATISSLTRVRLPSAALASQGQRGSQRVEDARLPTASRWAALASKVSKDRKWMAPVDNPATASNRPQGRGNDSWSFPRPNVSGR